MILLAILCIPLVLYLYLRRNDEKLRGFPASASAFSKERWTPEICHLAAEQLAESPLSVADQLPPRTGRRYIVVGGAGFIGGWVVLQLLQRGEEPRNIRVLDIRPPTRQDLTTGLAEEVTFIKVDVSDSAAVDAAFKAPWPSSTQALEGPGPQITIFHTVANIRFYERHPALISHSAKVNVEGTRNVIVAAKSIGASTLIYTSSGSVALRRSRFWLWPWETEPTYFVQVLNDDATIPKRHEEFFSNYAVTKMEAERLVRSADDTPSSSGVLRTGCIRPGNGVFGPGGDILCGAYLIRKHNPTWIANILQSFVYVENCSLAHLCYERRLIDIAERGSHPDIGGQAFTVTDPGPPPTYGDVYIGVETLGDAQFPRLSPTAMLLLAHLLESYYLTRSFLVSSTSTLLRYIACMLPQLSGEIINLQPSLFALTSVHLIFDDSRARLPSEKGGLGYQGVWTTLQGVCKTVEEYKKSEGLGEERSKAGGISLGFGPLKAKRGVEKSGQKLDLDVVQVLNLR